MRTIITRLRRLEEKFTPTDESERWVDELIERRRARSEAEGEPYEESDEPLFNADGTIPRTWADILRAARAQRAKNASQPAETVEVKPR
jgi:hypothetical protein